MLGYGHIPLADDAESSQERQQTDESLRAERGNTDSELGKRPDALATERAVADVSIRRERNERKQALANLLGLERDETDHNLLRERGHSDEALSVLRQGKLRASDGRANQALRESEARSLALFENSPLPKWLCDLENLCFLAVNDAAVRQYGYSREEFLQMCIADICPPGQLDAAVREHDGLSPHPSGVCKHKKKDGTLIDVEVTGHTFALEGIQARLIVAQDVTERRRAEGALRASEAQVRLLLDSTSEAIYGIDLEGKCTFANASCLRMLGYRNQSELLGRNMHETIHHTRRDGTAYPIEECAIFQAGLKEEGAVSDSEVLWRADGSSFEAEHRSFPLKRDGARLGAVVSFVDATERRKAEEAARWMRAIVDASWDAIIGTDAQGAITSWSPGAERMYGYTAAEARGRHISLIWASDRPEEGDEIIARVRRGERVQDFETVRVGKDGSRREVSISLSRIHAADGTIRGIAGTTRDITERRAAERQMRVMHDIALAASAAAGVDETLEAVLRILCQAADLPLAEAWVPASETRLQRRAHWVRSDERARLGAFLDDWPLERGTSLAGSAWETKQAVWTADLGRSSYPRAALAAELGIGAGVAAPVLVDGEVVAVIDGFFTRPREVDPALMALLATVGAQIGSLVQRRRAEEALRKSEEQLRQAQKMEAIGQLTGGVAHDFNNLLSVILSYSGMLAEDLEPTDPRRQDLLEIKAAGERAAALTQQLLAFSRRQVLQPRVVDLNQIVAGVEKMLRRVIGEDVELIVVSTPAPAKANVDPGQMEQVIMNLAVNARDAMPTGGKLTIAIASVELGEAFASEHAGVTAGPHILLSVTDTGCGMDAATQGRVYEPFFTTKERGKGTGLGLPTVFGIVRQSAGTIWLYSEPGKGTTFKIYLPRAEAGAEVAVPRPVEPVRLHGSETVLLVEDEEGVRKLARSILQRNGYRVLEAKDSAHALLLAGEHAAIDLLLTDVVMPQMSGAEIATRVLAQRPGLKLLYMSGYTDNAVVLHGVLRSEAAFVQKPFTPAVLLTKVREVLDARPAKAEARG